MFGFGDGRLIDEVAGGTGNLIGLLDAAGIGQPSWFWRDPFVLDFLFGTVGALCKISTAGKYSGDRLGSVVLTAIRKVAGHRDDQVGAEMIGLLRAQDPIFLSAAGEGADLVIATFQRRASPDQSAALMQTAWIDKVRERFRG